MFMPTHIGVRPWIDITKSTVLLPNQRQPRPNPSAFFSNHFYQLGLLTTNRFLLTTCRQGQDKASIIASIDRNMNPNVRKSEKSSALSALSGLHLKSKISLKKRGLDCIQPAAGQDSS
jgi:hypothetical protein